MTFPPGILHLLAFAAEPGGGNPAGVVLDAVGLDDARMQEIAADLGYPETAFVSTRNGRRARVRYFSPGAEVPFCGHATIATAVALAEAEGAGDFVFDTAAGEIALETTRDAEGRMTAGFTSVDPVQSDLEPEVGRRLLGILVCRRATSTTGSRSRSRSPGTRTRSSPWPRESASMRSTSTPRCCARSWTSAAGRAP